MLFWILWRLYSKTYQQWLAFIKDFYQCHKNCILYFCWILSAICCICSLKVGWITSKCVIKIIHFLMSLFCLSLIFKLLPSYSCIQFYSLCITGRSAVHCYYIICSCPHAMFLVFPNLLIRSTYLILTVFKLSCWNDHMNNLVIIQNQ